MADTLVGELIGGRYRATKELNRGGFGALYLAQDQQVRDKVVVIKVLSPREDSPDNEPWFRKKFETEIEALARINHPGVVAILDAGHLESGRPYLVMQYVEGYTLGNALTNLGLDLRRTANIVRQIGQALHAAHTKGVTHRDMKPENVMLTRLSDEIGPPKEHVTLIDFGIASVEDDPVGRKEKTRLAGSFAYMSPEQLDGRPVPASDLYSLGVIAYEMLTGQTPFSQESLFKFLASQRQGVKVKPRELRPEIPAAAEKLILAALAFKASDRPADIKEFADQLGQALEAGAADPAESPAARWGQHLMWITWAGFAILLAIAVFFGPQIGPWLKRTMATAPRTPARELSYSVSVQRYRDNKPYKEPFQLEREIVFEEDYRIRINLTTPQEGYLYIVNEGPELRNNLPMYVLLFPAATANGGNPRLSAGQTLRIPEQSEFRFDGQQGFERLWLVWASRQNELFSKLKPNQIEGDPETIQSLSKFLEQAAKIPHSSYSEEQSKRTTIKTQGDPLIHLIELRHQ